MKFIIFLWLSFALLTARSGDLSQPLFCTPQPVSCGPIKPADQFDAASQRALVERQLQNQPSQWQAIYFYVPTGDDGTQRELQIRYLEELLARERAKLPKD
jgi:hypothetical protein